MKVFYFTFIFFLLFSCKTTGDEQAIAYVEGKVVTNVSLEKIKLELKSGGTTISETLLLPGGNFTMSGPMLGSAFSLKSNIKIRSFSGRGDAKLSADSLAVIFPDGANYVKYLEINLAE